MSVESLRVSAVADAAIRVAIISARETPDVLMGAIESVRHADACASLSIDVIVNGNRQLAEDCRTRLSHVTADPQRPVRVWFIPFGDKSHAWNVYVHEIWTPARTTVFIDGYVAVDHGTIAAVDWEFTADPGLAAAAPVPRVGKSARKLAAEMQEAGGIHGNMFGLGKGAMERIRARAIRLPVGLYRSDALIGAILAFDFDPAANEWDLRRIKVLSQVSWTIAPTSYWSLGGMRTFMKRLVRQGQGVLENKAYRAHLSHERRQPEDLAATAHELVQWWFHRYPRDAWDVILRRPISGLALLKLARRRDWGMARLPKECIHADAELNSE